MSWSKEELPEFGWTIIANVDWDKQSPEWVEAAKRYRNLYLSTIS